MSEHRCIIVTKLFEKRDYEDLFRMPDGEVVPYSQLPPGALYEDRYPDHPNYAVNPKLPDGKTWTVKLPCGTPWFIDRQASKSGGFWTRQGEAPDFTIGPSIHITVSVPQYGPDDKGDEVTHHVNKTVYHGFLTGGVLRSTVDSPV